MEQAREGGTCTSEKECECIADGYRSTPYIQVLNADQE